MSVWTSSMGFFLGLCYRRVKVTSETTYYGMFSNLFVFV